MLFADFSELIFKSFFVYKVIDIEVPSFDVPSCLEFKCIFLGLQLIFLHWFGSDPANNLQIYFCHE